MEAEWSNADICSLESRKLKHPIGSYDFAETLQDFQLKGD